MGIVGIVLLCILTAVLFLLCIPVSFIAFYKSGEPVKLYLRWLFLKFDLLKQANKENLPEKKPKPEKEEKAKKAGKKTMAFSEMLGIVVDLLSSLKGGVGMLIRNFRLYKIRLYMVVAEGDAADTAIAYGKVNAAVYGAYAAASNFLNLEQPDIQIRPDFTAESGSIDREIRGRLIPIVALAAALRIGGSLVKTIKRKNQKPPEKPPSYAKPQDQQKDQLQNVE